MIPQQYVCLLTLFAILVHHGHALNCVCATSNVNIRNGPGTSNTTIGLLTTGSCLPYGGKSQTGGNYYWNQVYFEGGAGWIAINWLRNSTCSATCPTIVSRADWGARSPNSVISYYNMVPIYAFVHHTATRSCTTQSACASLVRRFQNYRMNNSSWSDIGHNFLIGEDGNVYEGRGWSKVGAHTRGYNTRGLGIGVIGTYTSSAPNAAAMTALQNLILCGVDQGKLTPSYKLRGHRDMGSTACPGTSLYNLITDCPHY